MDQIFFGFSIMRKTLLLLVSHLLVGMLGFAAGIYALPILTAPDAPSAERIAQMAGFAVFTGHFRKDLQDSDLLHQGEGEVTVGDEHITFEGSISPGPDYRLYLSPEFVETEQAFAATKPRMVEVGRVHTFDNFLVEVPAGIDVREFNTVIVWCESFGEFITAAQYQP
jgi:hypothetical protein